MPSNEKTLEKLRKQTNKLLAEHQHYRRVVKEEKQKLHEARDILEDTVLAQELAQEVAQRVQQQVHDQIAGIVTRCLEAIFDDPYEFQIQFEQKRGKTEARFVFLRDGHEISPMQASGGGVVDVAAFALRLSAVLLSRPRLRRLLVLDEPFRFVGANNRGRLRGLLEQLATDMGFQFIIVTHITDFQVGKVIDLEQEQL